MEHRVGDRRIIHLIRKWLRAGVLEDGIVTVSERGTGQGSVISPLLSNIYLRYVFDLWADRWRRREATGDMIIVRYADDIVVGFEHEADARPFWDMMRQRLQEFALQLHPEKTRLIEFGRYAAQARRRKGLGKPETFNFLGFTHICGKTRQGRFQILRKSRRDRRVAKLTEVKNELRRRMHWPIPEQGRWLKQVLAVYYVYHAVPTNFRSLGAFRDRIIRLWVQTLRRRSRMREFRSSGSVRGVPSNGHPYRDICRKSMGWKAPAPPVLGWHRLGWTNRERSNERDFYRRHRYSEIGVPGSCD